MEKYLKAPLRVQLRQEQYDLLYMLARHRRLTVGALIRQAVDGLLTTAPETLNELLSEEDGWPADQSAHDHPLWQLVGPARAGINDWAESHDLYITEYEDERTHHEFYRSSYPRT